MTGQEIMSFLVVTPFLVMIVTLLVAVAWVAVGAVCLISWGIWRAAAWLFSKLG